MYKLFIKGKVVESSDDTLKEDQQFKLQGRRSFRGLDIAIENKKGSIRKGINDDGTSWKTLMKFDYGYIRKTESPNDGEKIDVYLGPDESSDKAFIVNQNNPFTGKFDEQKVMLCFPSADEAKKAYLSQYDNPKFFGSMIEMPFEEFKEKALRTEKKSTILKAFGRMLKAFGGQIGLFEPEVFTGQTKDDKTLLPSKVNPRIRRWQKPGGDKGSEESTSGTKQAVTRNEYVTGKYEVNVYRDRDDTNAWNIELSKNGKLTHRWSAYTEAGKGYRIKHANELKKILEEKEKGDASHTRGNREDASPLFGEKENQWKVTQKEFIEHQRKELGDKYEMAFEIGGETGKGIVGEHHYKIVKYALEQGMQVPPEVLKDYPELAEKYKKAESNDRQKENKRLTIGQRKTNQAARKPEPKTSDMDLFNQPDEPPARPEKKDGEPKTSSTDKTELIENFGVTHLSEKVRKQRIDINKKVKELLASKKDNEMTSEDKKLLATYSGRGGTDEISLNEYYTPEYVAKFQWDMLQKLGFKGGPVIEPACGAGVFLYTSPDDAFITAVEYDETSSRIAKILFPEHEVYNTSFEKFNTGSFDKGFNAAIGNVPFGPRGITAKDDREKMKYDSHEQYFLDRIIDDLEEGGVASIIVPTGIMDNQLGEYRLSLNKKAEFLGAIRMPTGVFHKANAEVTTDIVFFRKRDEDVADRLSKLQDNELSELLDAGVLNVQFINGSYFDKNPEMALGEKTRGKFITQKIWKDDISEEDLQRLGSKINISNNESDKLKELGISTKSITELHVGDTITRNGRTYRLNENHRWERVTENEVKSELLPEDIQKLFGVKSRGELNEIRSDISKILLLNREQISALDDIVAEELEHYTSTNTQKDEMLKRATVLGLAIKEFQKTLQTGYMSTTVGSNGEVFTAYSPMSYSDANVKAQKLAMLLDDFKATYGHPVDDAKLNTQMGKSSGNPMLYIVSSFDSKGNLSKLFTDPMAFYNVYYPKSQAVDDIDTNNLLSIIHYYKENGLSATAEEIKRISAIGKDYSDLEFKKMLLGQEDIFIDESGNYGAINDVCMGEIYSKLDYWDKRISGNKMSLTNDNLTDDEREYLVAENKKLETQDFELRRRAGIRTLENLPIDLSDAGKFFDIKYLNDYLTVKLGMDFKGEVIYDAKRHLFTFADESLNHIYRDFIAGKTKGGLDKQDKEQLERGLKHYFDNNKNPLMLVTLNSINGLSSGTIADSAKAKIADIQDGFVQYLSEMATDRTEIENKYNRSYNNFIQKEYDGSVIEGIDKLDYDKVVAKDKDGKDITVRDKITPYNWAVVRRMIEQKKGLIAHGVGLGKAQPLDSLILTPGGYVKMGDVFVGQEVINSQGGVSIITGIYPKGKLEAFEVGFNDGSSIVCNDEHLWAVRTEKEQAKNKPFKVMSLKEIIPNIKTKGKYPHSNYRIPMIDPVRFPKQEVLIDPYLLGLLLGDGGLSCGVIISLNQKDTDIVQYCDNIAKKYGVELKQKLNDKISYAFASEHSGANNDLMNRLRELNLMGKKSAEKFIPKQYLINDVETRLAILRGLIDTDGYISKDGLVIQFTTVSKQLNEDVKFLVHSLGGVAREHGKQGAYNNGTERVICQWAYTLTISLPPNIIPVRCKRRLERFKPKDKYKPNRIIKSVKFIGKTEMQCIMVYSPDHLYVTNDMILTHNTAEAILVGLVAKATGTSKKPTYVVPKSVMGNWVSEINKWTKGSNILVIGAHQVFDKDGNPKLDENGRELWPEDDANEKKVKLSRLVNEDFDFVLMTRNFYSTIKLSPQSIENMLNELVDKFYVSSGDENDKAAEKKRQVLVKDLSEKFLGDARKDKFGKYIQSDEIYFENLGIDMVVSDEIHSNKNLIQSVLYGDTKYLNNKYSNRAVDFYFKSKIIRNNNNDGGVYGLTATPVSNSPLEVFNILLPIAEKQFEQMGINNVDDFIKKFGDMGVMPTMDASAKISNARIFKGFKQANLLRKMFFRYTDYKTSDMVGAQVHFPKENPNIIFCEQSPIQKEIIKGLRLRLLYQEYGRTDMTEAIKEGFLSEKEAQEIKDYADVHKRKAETLKTFSKDEEPKDYYFNILDDMKKATADVEWYASAKSAWADPLPPAADYARSPKMMQAVENVVTKHKDGGKQLIFAENVNLHQKLKDELVKSGIPANEIFIVNSKTVNSSDKRLLASDNYNNGKYKIIIGNYATMGEGLNFNIGTTDIHHLQPAWNALSIEQGNGRGIRQGNVLDKVNTHYYLTKGTVDAFFNQKILDKRGFVNELLNGTSDNVKLEDGDISADEVQIALAENPEQARKLLQKKNEAFVRIMKERELKQNFSKLDQYYGLKNRLARTEDKTSMLYDTINKDLEKIKSDLAGSRDFDFGDALKQDMRPIILPESKEVINIGSVIDAHGEKGVVTSYSHSTGKIKINYYPQYGSNRVQILDHKDFANAYGKYYEKSTETAEDYFNDLIENKKIYAIDKIEGLPKDIFQKNRYQIMANIQKNGKHQMAIAKKSDGTYVGTSVEYALDHNYDLVFPQDRDDYYDVIDQAVKTVNPEYDKARSRYEYYSSQDMAETVANRIYGDSWERKIKYLKTKAQDKPVTEIDQIEFDDAA